MVDYDSNCRRQWNRWEYYDLRRITFSRRLLGRLGRQIGAFHLVGFVPAWLQSMFGKGFGKQMSDHGLLVGIVDLVAAHSLTYPGLQYTLRIADRDAFMPRAYARVLFVGPNRKLRDVAVHRPLSHVETNVITTPFIDGVQNSTRS